MGGFEDLWDDVAKASPWGKAWENVLAADATWEEKELAESTAYLKAIGMLLGMGAFVAGGSIIPSLMRHPPVDKKARKKWTPPSEAQIIAAQTAYSKNVSALMGNPMFALPFTYLAIQALEGSHVISEGLGNSMQALIATLAASGIARSIAAAIP